MKKARKASKRKVAPRSRAMFPAARYITREDLATLRDEIEELVGDATQRVDNAMLHLNVAIKVATVSIDMDLDYPTSSSRGALWRAKPGCPRAGATVGPWTTNRRIIRRQRILTLMQTAATAPKVVVGVCLKQSGTKAAFLRKQLALSVAIDRGPDRLVF